MGWYNYTTDREGANIFLKFSVVLVLLGMILSFIFSKCDNKGNNEKEIQGVSKVDSFSSQTYSEDDKSSSPEKRRSSIISIDAPFIKTSLKINPLNKSNIQAHLQLINTGRDSILLYKNLLPIGGILKNKIFFIFSKSSFNNVPYIGIKSDRKYIGADVIVPELSSNNFVQFAPHDTLNYVLNLAEFYDFTPFIRADQLSFACTFSIDLPSVSSDHKQNSEFDSIDQKLKPIYYWIHLPEHEDLDSMRVAFHL